MIKILFVCHGNICRSPMAEFLFQKYVDEKGYSSLFHIESAATSTEEIGNPIHRGTAKILEQVGIPYSIYSKKKARQITSLDVKEYDYIIAMDNWNIRNLIYMFGENNKFKLLKSYLPDCMDDEISDPWYTGDFNLTYNDISKSITYLFDELINKYNK